MILAIAALTLVLLTQQPFRKSQIVLHYFGCDWVLPKEFEQVNQGIYARNDAVKGASFINFLENEDPDSEDLKRFEHSDDYIASFNRVEQANDINVDSLFLFKKATSFVHISIMIKKLGADNVFYMGQLDVEDAITFTQNCVDEPIIREIYDRYAVWLEEHYFKG